MGNEPERSRMKYVLLARYGAMSAIGAFATTIKNLRFGEKCILRTNRGTEWGEVTREAWRVGEDPDAPRPEGTVVRRCAPNDYERHQHIEDEVQPEEYNYCATCIGERELPMRLASVEHIFGGEKVIFYFLADGRVDFRQLVKDLATQYRTRIEMRQIGVRDEARLLAEYEHCGRELCCRTFMKDLQPVTMRMAKLQKTTLDPTKISGRCGRLMCCLRFEDDIYSELKKALPKRGARVQLEDGVAEVISSEVLAQSLVVEYADNRRIKIEVSDIQEVLPKETPKTERRPPAPPKPEPDEAAPTSRAKSGAGSAEGGKPKEGDRPPSDRKRRSRRRRRPRNKARAEGQGGEQPKSNDRAASQPAAKPEAKKDSGPAKEPSGDRPPKKSRRRRSRGGAGRRRPQDKPRNDAGGGEPKKQEPPKSDGQKPEQQKPEQKKPEKPANPGKDTGQDKLPTDEWWEN